MITVDKAQQSDIDALVSLLGSLFAQEAEFSADPSKQAVGLKLILDDSSIGQILVARKDGILIGMVNLLFTVSTALGQRVAILDDLIVSPTARSNGVGKRLMDAAIQYCSEGGFARISLQTDFDNHLAQSLYESKGFVRSRMLAYKRIL
jgi:GNAT superfamily N-acetyltransferase